MVLRGKEEVHVSSLTAKSLILNLFVLTAALKTRSYVRQIKFNKSVQGKKYFLN
jgi:hypothetical protein